MTRPIRILSRILSIAIFLGTLASCAALVRAIQRIAA